MAQNESIADISIIGGGPAGLALAIELQHSHLSTRLHEKGQFPIDKICGEGILPRGHDFLKKHSILDYIKVEDRFEFQGLCLVANKHKKIYAHFDDNRRGIGIKRTNLSAALFQRAREVDNLTIHQQSRFEKIVESQYEGFIYQTADSSNKNLSHWCKYLVGADGLYSGLKKQVHCEKEGFFIVKRFGTRFYVNIPPWSKFVESYWGDHIEAIITPIGENQVEVSVMMDGNYHNPRNIIDLAFLKKQFPLLFDQLPNLTNEDIQLRAYGPLSRGIETSIQPQHLFFIGDARGFYDSLSGEGISVAFTQAEILAHILKKNLKSKNFLFQQAIARDNRKIITFTSMGLFFSQHSQIRKTIYTYAPSTVFQKMVDWTIL